MKENQRRGVVLAVAGALWGAAYLIPYKAATAVAPAAALALPMLLVAALLNTASSAVQRTYQRLLLDRTAVVVALVLGALTALANEAMAQALGHIDPGLTSVLLRTQVLWVALGGWWLLGERSGRAFWLGVALALPGFVLLQRHLGDSSGLLQGAAWALLSACSFGAMQVVVRHTAHRIHPMVVNSLRLWVSVVLLAAVPGRLAFLVNLDSRVWLLTSLAAAFGPVISRIFLMLSLRHVSAAVGTLVQFVAPAFAFVLGGVFFATWPDLLEIAGSLLILAGVALPVIAVIRQPPT